MERVYPAAVESVRAADAGVVDHLADLGRGAHRAPPAMCSPTPIRSFEVYIVVALVYLALSVLYRAAFWAIGLGLFARKRRLGTPL